MARIEDLLTGIEDPVLRAEIEREVAVLKEHVSFGLVFERHIPETVDLLHVEPAVGDLVRLRRESGDALYRVFEMNRGSATLTPLDGGKNVEATAPDLLVVKPFGEPIYPTLTPLGSVVRSDERPFHAVINGENLHALQLLLYLYEGQVDCIYIDPPYNTGAQDWKYNNRFVDKNDDWRHSKWLSFMERRLRAAKLLLKPDGVLVISIDENEHAHLVCLLEDVFAGWDITSIAIVHNPRGIQGDNFSHTNDFAVFVTPPGAKAIAKRPVEADAQKETRFRVWGDQSERKTAKNCFFPIYVEDEGVVGFGEVPPDDFHPESAVIDQGDGRYEVWPIDNSRTERKWRNQRKTIDQVAHLLRPEWIKGQLQIRIDKDTAMHKTVWSGSRYDAGSHGKRLLNKVLGVDFDYPKSLYAMRDILYACTGNRKDAVILDYLAGSGTTLHASCLLNAEDGGRRRCILVTNNEVGAKTAAKLNKAGRYPGDKDFERHGIFEAVTRPRCERAITGVGADGKPLTGEYEGDRARSDGFGESVEFFRLDYLEPDQVELGKAFDAIHPALWLITGGKAPRPDNVDHTKPFYVAAHAGYAILFDDGALREFEQAIEGRDDITHVFVVTDSEEAFIDARELVGHGRQTSMIYRDYLRTFRINTPQELR